MISEDFLKEIEAFTKTPHKITLSNGETLSIKPLNWGKELKIIKIIGKLINKASNVNGIVQSLDSSDLVANLGVLLEESPEALTEICSIITELPEEEIIDKFVFEDIVEICFPFLASLVKRVQKKVVEKVEVVSKKKKQAKKKGAK